MQKYQLFTVKFLLFLFFIAGGINNLFSQRLPGNSKPYDEDTPVKKDKSNSFYAAFMAKDVNMGSKWGIEVGGRVGVSFKSTFGIGIGFFTLISENIEIKADNLLPPGFLTLGYGGLEFEYYLKLTDFLGVSPLLMAGLGRINHNYGYQLVESTYAGQWIFILEPSISLNLRIATGIWITGGIGYRSTSGVDYLNLKDKDLSGIVLLFSLKTLNN